MTRTAWIAVILLLGSNAAWVALWLGRDDAPREPVFERAELEQTIATLQDEVHLLRARDEEALPSDGPELSGLLTEGPNPAQGGPRDTQQEGPRTPEEEAAAAEAAAQAKAQAAEKARVSAEALSRVKEILTKIMQVKDPALRSEGLQELHAALGSTEPTMVEYALSALHSLRTLDFDRSEFRSTVLDLMQSDQAGIRRSALYALFSTGAREGDERFALAAVQDPDPLVRQHALRVLKLYNGGAFSAEDAGMVAKLLRDEVENVRRGTLRGLSGSRVTPEIEKALIAAAQEPAQRLEVVQHGLSTLRQKSRTVIDVLFGYLEDENPRVRARAHWGLQREIPDASKPYVARRYAQHLETFLNPKSHREALKIIARFGDASLAPDLDRFADNELVDASVREMARNAAEYLRRK